MKINYNSEIINSKLCYRIFIDNNNDNIIAEYTFNRFIALWKDLYKNKTYFCFLFNTMSLTAVSPHFYYKLVTFLKTLKQHNTQYLNFSIIIINNNFVKMLVNTILKIVHPITTIYIVKSINTANELLDIITSNNIVLESFILINKINVINKINKINKINVVN